MRQEKLAPEIVVRGYMSVLSEAIRNVRMRIRYGESIDMQELHDLMDGIENIPEMLCAYGGWHIEENIDRSLNRYDERWYKPGSTSMRSSLMKTLQRERERLNTPPEVQPDA